MSPWPLVRLSTGVAPPRLRAALLTATCTSFWPWALVLCSKLKLPLSVWPTMFRLRPVPDTLKYGPAGTVSVTGVVPTVNVWLTAAVVVLNASATLPPTLTPPAITAMVPLT